MNKNINNLRSNEKEMINTFRGLSSASQNLNFASMIVMVRDENLSEEALLIAFESLSDDLKIVYFKTIMNRVRTGELSGRFLIGAYKSLSQEEIDKYGRFDDLVELFKDGLLSEEDLALACESLSREARAEKFRSLAELCEYGYPVQKALIETFGALPFEDRFKKLVKLFEKGDFSEKNLMEAYWCLPEVIDGSYISWLLDIPEVPLGLTEFFITLSKPRVNLSNEILAKAFDEWQTDKAKISNFNYLLKYKIDRFERLLGRCSSKEDLKKAFEDFSYKPEPYKTIMKRFRYVVELVEKGDEPLKTVKELSEYFPSFNETKIKSLKKIRSLKDAVKEIQRIGQSVIKNNVCESFLTMKIYAHQTNMMKREYFCQVLDMFEKGGVKVERLIKKFEDLYDEVKVVYFWPLLELAEKKVLFVQDLMKAFKCLPALGKMLYFMQLVRIYRKEILSEKDLRWAFDVLSLEGKSTHVGLLQRIFGASPYLSGSLIKNKFEIIIDRTRNKNNVPRLAKSHGKIKRGFNNID